MNWDEIKLEVIADFRNGVNFTNDSFGKGIKVINVADFKDFMYPNYENLGELDSEAKWHKDSFLKENDIVFVRSNGNKNLIGRSLFIKDLPTNIKVTYSAFSIRLRFKFIKDICPEFYLYLFKSPIFRSILSQYGNGANISNLNQDILNNMVVPKPPLLVQQKIASILSSYDELIENNKQRIRLLEEMAEEIYKEWFVRLRFPGYETAKIVDGLPEGWEKVKADQIFDIKIGKTPPREETKWFTENKQGIKWISIRDINSSSVFIFNTNEEIVYDGISKFNLNIVKKNTVILSFKLTVGKIAIATEDMVSNEAIAHFNIINESIMNREYIYCYLKNFQYAELGNTSSIGNAINSKIVKRMPIIKPAKNIINRFSESICSMLDEIDVLNQKNQLLQETRDLLLPRLINGKLSVEHLVEEELGMVAEEKAIYKNKNHN